jgi:ubiquinone/menaquinone biosynthesis C-methylase UbiE
VARVTDGSNPVTGIDISPYLLREAVSLTGNESLDKFIEYREGSAEAIPFDDDTFDATMAITMMEEADAEVVLSELVRVTRPGGRVAVVVRALDMPGWSSLPLRPELKKKLEATTFGGREPQGCADAALYQLFRNAGLTNLKRYPQLVTVEATTPTALNYYSTMMSRTLSGDELEEWRAARAKAEETGSYFLAMPYHCAVGTKP